MWSSKSYMVVAFGRDWNAATSDWVSGLILTRTGLPLKPDWPCLIDLRTRQRVPIGKTAFTRCGPKLETSQFPVTVRNTILFLEIIQSFVLGYSNRAWTGVENHREVYKTKETGSCFNVEGAWRSLTPVESNRRDGGKETEWAVSPVAEGLCGLELGNVKAEERDGEHWSWQDRITAEVQKEGKGTRVSRSRKGITVCWDVKTRAWLVGKKS